MGKVKRAGYVFLSWKGDHSPRHVHAYRNGALVVKWDLENGQVMKGRISVKLRRLIETLDKEGLL